MRVKRLLWIAALIAAPILVAAAASPETTGTFESAAASAARIIEWAPAPGPVDMNPTPPVVDDAKNPKGLTVHEWGTFTSIAGPDGKAVQWAPAGGPTDLPCFVALTDPSNVKGPVGPAETLGGRAGLGTVRMETPVIYFYSPVEQFVNVKVLFRQGLITEWYPSANATVTPNRPIDAIKNLSAATGVIQWNNVQVLPGGTENYPQEIGQSHYYAARRTGSAPLHVGSQYEKFLFYRGIAEFTPPIAATVNADGRIDVSNLGNDVIPAVFLFENRGGKIGFRAVRDIEKTVTLEAPKLTADFASLQQSLEGTLRAQGMFPQEAAAMIDTWKDTWFEQGTRIFYIMPSKAVDAVLPLSIDPQPLKVARAFVGRMEVITEATQSEVRNAIRTNNRSVMETYGRFVEPIVSRFLGDTISESERTQAVATIASIRKSYVEAVSACRSGKGW